MKSIMITQPMLFPWVGLFEQIQIADVFVFYDDVQFSKGSFSNRVQLKSPTGSEWMTIPLSQFHLGQLIMNTTASENKDWRKKHFLQLEKCYSTSKYYDDLCRLVNECYSLKTQSLNEITIQSMLSIINYFDLYQGSPIVRSSELASTGTSTQRVLDIVLELECDTYVTGHGASKYLDHQLFEDKGINVQYMNYQKLQYPQLYGDFTPYVSILDLIANHGKNGKQFIKPETINWQDFLNERN